MERIITDNMERITQLCRKYHVKRLYVFGSATGHGIDGNLFAPESDIDLLVEFTDIIYDFENFHAAENFFNLIDELKSLFGRDVDLVEESAIRNRRFKQYVEQQKQLIYAA